MWYRLGGYLMACELCRERGVSGRQAYRYRFADGQRITLCLSHARVLRMTEPVEWHPEPYGRETREAELALAIVEEL